MMRLPSARASGSGGPLPLLERRRLPLLLLLLFSAAAALACDGRGRGAGGGTAGTAGGAAGGAAVGGAAADGAPTGVRAAGAPRRGGTLVMGWIAEPAGVNEIATLPSAVQSEMLIQLFLRLVEEQPDYERHPPSFAPSLARSYEWSPDHKALTFHLREDARWSDGVPVTADDVRWTWQAEISPEVAWPYSFMKSEIADVEVVDPHTARFRFKRVYAKQLLDANEAGILPRHAWEKLPFSQWRQGGEWFKRHLVVDGPFTIESWKPQQEIVLRRNPSYFDPGRPYLERAVFRVIPDQASILAQLDGGDLDYAPAISPGDAGRVAANPRLRLLAFWFRTWVGIGWNCARQPFADPEVRRALSLGLDRQAIVDTVWNRFARMARVCDSPILASVWAHDRALRPLPYRPDEARRVLAARGFAPGPDGVLRRGGKPFELELMTNAGNQQRVNALVMIQEQLRRIGVRALPRQVEFNTMNAQVDAGRFDATLIGTNLDTSLDLSAQFHSREIGAGGTNITRYSNPEVDRLLDHANGLPDIALARPDLDRIQELLQRDQPYTFLWESQRLSAFDRRLHGVQPGVLFSLYTLRDWWLEPAAAR
jgi:peptide/nickel transport system substrate-binding protein